jgi:hypothetical protein
MDGRTSMYGHMWMDVGGWKGLDGRNWTFETGHANVRRRLNKCWMKVRRKLNRRWMEIRQISNRHRTEVKQTSDESQIDIEQKSNEHQTKLG